MGRLRGGPTHPIAGIRTDIAVSTCNMRSAVTRSKDFTLGGVTISVEIEEFFERLELL